VRGGDLVDDQIKHQRLKDIAQFEHACQGLDRQDGGQHGGQQKSTEGQEEGDAHLPEVALEGEAAGPRDEGEDIRRLQGRNGNDRADDVAKEGPDEHALQ
jgi:hypothetical protein